MTWFSKQVSIVRPAATGLECQQDLGNFTVRQVRKGLRKGEFLDSDHFIVDDMVHWMPLAQFESIFPNPNYVRVWSITGIYLAVGLLLGGVFVISRVYRSGSSISYEDQPGKDTESGKSVPGSLDGQLANPSGSFSPAEIGATEKSKPVPELLPPVAPVDPPPVHKNNKNLDKALDSVVKIKSQYPGLKQPDYGVGIIIDKAKGYVLTCMHCVVHPDIVKYFKGAKNAQILGAGITKNITISSDGVTPHQGRVIHVSKDPNVDLAIIQCTDPDVLVGEIRVEDFHDPSLSQRQKVWMAGFPQGFKRGAKELVFNNSDERWIHYSTEVEPGWSGSLVLQQDDLPIGIMNYTQPDTGTSQAITGQVVRNYWESA